MALITKTLIFFPMKPISLSGTTALGFQWASPTQLGSHTLHSSLLSGVPSQQTFSWLQLPHLEPHYQLEFIKHTISCSPFKQTAVKSETVTFGGSEISVNHSFPIFVDMASEELTATHIVSRIWDVHTGQDMVLSIPQTISKLTGLFWPFFWTNFFPSSTTALRSSNAQHQKCCSGTCFLKEKCTWEFRLFHLPPVPSYTLKWQLQLMTKCDTSVGLPSGTSRLVIEFLTV